MVSKIQRDVIAELGLHVPKFEAKRSNGSFPTVENSNEKMYIALESVYCSRKQVFTISHFAFYLIFNLLFDFISI